MKVDSNGVSLDVQVEGDADGTPVVLLHGFPDSKRLWTKQVPVLADAGFRVIVPDQRGYGASDKPEDVEAYSLVFLAMLGVVGARAGGAGILRPTIRVTFWGALAMAVTAGVGLLIGRAV